ncbi:Actin [Hondaea fermentalgiana]|uniref:Actin n=1 Tax=Hondaea fermentalgiana TaxID=2315210 RepID=A0A2R5GSH6_9STRA|nr:Actin [Hondaea fermentalgiana]|eukprot:GBG33800.1 Actin [Hondaea fermentalgiana]
MLLQEKRFRPNEDVQEEVDAEVEEEDADQENGNVSSRAPNEDVQEEVDAEVEAEDEVDEEDEEELGFLEVAEASSQAELGAKQPADSASGSRGVGSSLRSAALATVQEKASMMKKRVHEAKTKVVTMTKSRHASVTQSRLPDDDEANRSCKAGFADSYGPTAIVPWVVGRVIGQAVGRPLVGPNAGKDIYYGSAATHCRLLLSTTSPIEKGLVNNWDDMEALWHHTFYSELGVDPSEQPLLITEPLLTPKINRERTIQIMFETFNVPAYYVVSQPALSLYSTGRSTGLVLESGDGLTQVGPIYESYALPFACQTIDIAGRQLTDYTKRVLEEDGFRATTRADMRVVVQIKEKLGYVAQKYDEGTQLGRKSFDLPDGNCVYIENDQCSRFAEPLFQPHLVERWDDVGVHEMVFRSIGKCDEEIRKDLYENILLAGGSTLFKGFGDRLKSELFDLGAPFRRALPLVEPPAQDDLASSMSSQESSDEFDDQDSVDSQDERVSAESTEQQRISVQRSLRASLRINNNIVSKYSSRSSRDVLFEGQALVIDNGSSICKAGFSDESAPRAVFPSVVGHPKRHGAVIGTQRRDAYVGSEAQTMRSILTLRDPIEYGIVTHWEDMERVWRYTFYDELRVAPEDFHVLLTEAPLNPKANREHMTTIMFETFNVSAMYVTINAVLALFATGRTTGVVLDSGDGATHAVPIYEGSALLADVVPTQVAGHNLTDFMVRLLGERGHLINTKAEHENVCKAKEELCYVAYDFDAEYEVTAGSSSLEMSHGSITISSERFQCPEALFEPSLIGDFRTPGVHHAIYRAIMNCDSDMRNELFANIVLSGGSTMFEGFPARLEKELIILAPANAHVRVIAPPKRNYSAWIGGTQLAALPQFQQMWISKQEYDAAGPCVVNTKCF